MGGRGDEPGWNVAQRFRFAPAELGEVRAEIHRHLRARGRTACTWEVGSSATPDDLVERLLAAGLVEEPGSSAVGMVLTDPPQVAFPEGIEVRRAGSDAEESIAAERWRVAFRRFGQPPAASTPILLVVTYLSLPRRRACRPRHRCLQRVRRLALRRRGPARRPWSWRLPRARARALCGGCGARHAVRGDPGRRDVLADPRARLGFR